MEKNQTKVTRNNALKMSYFEMQTNSLGLDNPLTVLAAEPLYPYSPESNGEKQDPEGIKVIVFMPGYGINKVVVKIAVVKELAAGQVIKLVNPKCGLYTTKDMATIGLSCKAEDFTTEKALGKNDLETIMAAQLSGFDKLGVISNMLRFPIPANEFTSGLPMRIIDVENSYPFTKDAAERETAEPNGLNVSVFIKGGNYKYLQIRTPIVDLPEEGTLVKAINLKTMASNPTGGQFSVYFSADGFESLEQNSAEFAIAQDEPLDVFGNDDEE